MSLTSNAHIQSVVSKRQSVLFRIHSPFYIAWEQELSIACLLQSSDFPRNKAKMTHNDKAMQTHIQELQQQLKQMKANPGSSVFDAYQTSLTARYCSSEMSQLFSQRSRHSTWRKLWLYLAESERELGIEAITPEALEQMRDRLEVSDADFEVARVEEKKRRHDVMAHVHAFGAPAAAPIIHYGVSTQDGFLRPLLFRLLGIFSQFTKRVLLLRYSSRTLVKG